MSLRNVTRDAHRRQAERINRAPAGQADAARSAARANRARQRGCTSPGLRDSPPVGHADRESTPRLLSRQRPSNPAMRNRIASGARGRSGIRIQARAGRACARWLRFWRRTLIGGSISAGKNKRGRRPRPLLSEAEDGLLRARDSDGESAQQVLIERCTGLNHVADRAGRAPGCPALTPLARAGRTIACAG